MKKLFTIDDFAIAFVSAMGYGYGETLARLFGWPELLCVAASFALGIASEEIVYAIAFSKAVQKKPARRFGLYAAIVLLFLAAHWFSVRWMGVSLMDYLLEEFGWVVGLPVLGFVVNLLIRKYRVQKIRELYGDGSQGYVFDLKKEDIEETNRQNRAVSGAYDSDLAVRTRTGIYVGERHDNTVFYMGIPYAAPPVGSLRWKAPEPLPSSEAVYEAINFGASAVQVEHKGLILKHHRQSEDCLTLNICVGDQEKKGGKPVLVLFHHGDYTYGGSADPLLYGNRFVSAHPDTVFVSFNYRLGIFGFIDFSEVPGGEAYPDALNLGLLDQIAALRWIRENIAAFGGDPDNITAMGFESGAGSILMLAASEKAKGLFQRALVFFGSPEDAYDTPQNARALARDLLKETGASSMEELQKLDTETLKAAAQKLWRNILAPTRDGVWFPNDLYSAFREGAASGISFIIGISGNERQVFHSVLGDQNYADMVKAAAEDMRNALYSGDSGASEEDSRTEAFTREGISDQAERVEQWLASCMYQGAECLIEGGSKVHLMYWEDKPLIGKLGAGTVDAAASLLGNREALQMYGNVMNEELSEVLQALLKKFAAGEALRLYPNEIKGVDALNWKAFPGALTVSEGRIQVSGKSRG